jgi:hypothetical protein
MANTQRDIYFSLDGDLAVDMGDLKMANGNECSAQLMNICAKTQTGEATIDWPAADLEIFVGESNTREVGQTAAKQLYNSITENGLADYPRLEVIPIPVQDAIILCATVSEGDDETTYSYSLNL